MFLPYEPCEGCLFEVCDRCAYGLLQKEYQRAVERIAELSPTPITILTWDEEESK